ncbi:Pro-resilin-like 115 [Homarus americanus]|uniref:Pro-resilin-like 115 n=1 Tax=Homarus americanus TaxID=6706 RepID=A0A8J5MVR3_HOMAM|nr:Pro-resilin-like 115 [Homarus americanus]
MYIVIFSCLVMVALARPEQSALNLQNFQSRSPRVHSVTAHANSDAIPYTSQGGFQGKTADFNPTASASAGYQGTAGHQTSARGHQAPASVAYQAPIYTAFDQSGGGAGAGYQNPESPGYRAGGGIIFSGVPSGGQGGKAVPEYDGSTFHGADQVAHPHTFGYAVDDSYFGNQHAHNEYSDGQTTKGSYRVLLPDGRTQVVNYSADAKSGFQAQVTYEGEAKPYQPPEKAASGFNPQAAGGGGSPSYQEQQALYRPSA